MPLPKRLQSESEWLSVIEPWGMIQWILDHGSANRKLWLFACACCRRYWGYLEQESREIIARCEILADQPSAETETEKKELCFRANAVVTAIGQRPRENDNQNPKSRLRRAAAAVCYAATGDPWGAHSYFCEIDASEAAVQCNLLRDIFGNPFRPSRIDPDWLTWRDGTAVKLAQAIYDDRRYDLLPILADALHETGCCDDAILDHCRGSGPHVRGCWVVDLVLGKS
jgi:hypothetical protein